jgi:glycosyltransferase involved in cell wall biosynthesis
MPDVMEFKSLKLLNHSSGGKGWPWIVDGISSAAQNSSRASPRITVVTPSFNQGRFIEETIRSVLLQDYPNLEYIIIDGGSTDNTVEIIKKYEPWLSYWVSEKDRGQSHAINKGFARATGDIFAWLCSDDVYAPGALNRVAEVMAKSRNAMVIGDAVITDGPDTLGGKLDRRRPSFEEMAYNVKTFPQPSTFWTRDLWEAAKPLREDLYFVMDYDLWLRMVPLAKSVKYLDEILSYQRTQPDQKSANRLGSGPTYLSQRAQVACSAALRRGESRLSWAARVWAMRFRKVPISRWPAELLTPGFHWQVTRHVLKSACERPQKL